VEKNKPQNKKPQQNPNPQQKAKRTKQPQHGLSPPPAGMRPGHAPPIANEGTSNNPKSRGRAGGPALCRDNPSPPKKRTSIASGRGTGPAPPCLPVLKTSTCSKKPRCFSAKSCALGGGRDARGAEGTISGGEGEGGPHPREFCRCLSSRGRKKKKKLFFSLGRAESLPRAFHP